MRKLIQRASLALAVSLASLSGVLAAEFKLGDITIVQPVARATPANAPVSAGYMKITNSGGVADRLVAASVSFAGTTEIHEMTMDGDVMKMREIEGGIEIPAGSEVTLMPGGLHIMFMKLGGQLKAGETRNATLTFEKAGTIEVELSVENLAEIRKNMGAGKMDMNHSDPSHGGMKKAQ